MNAPLPSAAAATCSLHPTLAATATCARCGRFACSACLPGRKACRDCAAQVLASSPVLRRAQWARWMLIANAGFDVLLTLQSVAFLYATQQGAELHVVVAAAIGLPSGVIAIATAVTFLMWLHSFIAALEAMKLELSDSPAVAVVWWFVPFANLVKPYQTLREAMVELRSEVLVDQTRLGWWWGLYLLGNFGALLVMVAWLPIVAQLLSVISALLAARMLRLIGSALCDFAGRDTVVEALPVAAPPLAPAANA